MTRNAITTAKLLKAALKGSYMHRIYKKWRSLAKKLIAEPDNLDMLLEHLEYEKLLNRKDHLLSMLMTDVYTVANQEEWKIKPKIYFCYNIKLNNYQKSVIKKKIEKALATIGKKVNILNYYTHELPAISIFINPKETQYCHPGIIFLAATTRKRDIYHEFGHYLECNIQEMSFKTLFTKRTKGKNKIAFKDIVHDDNTTGADFNVYQNFVVPYMGREYTKGNGTECLSLALEWILCECGWATALIAEDTLLTAEYIKKIIFGGVITNEQVNKLKNRIGIY